MLAHRNPYVRANAALAFGRLAGPAGTPRLVDLLAHDPSAKVRAAAARALGLVGGAAAELSQATGDADDLAREAARAALAGPKPPARDTWIHLSFADDDGAPVRFERYVVVDPTGLIKAGYTDTRGEAGEELFPEGLWSYDLLDEEGREEPLRGQ